MATSGSIDFKSTRQTLIEDAMYMIEALGVGETLSSEDMSLGSRTLNRMLKAWTADGIQLWKTSTATVFLEKGQKEYTLGSSSGDQASESVVNTTLGAAEASGQTVITVTSSTGMTAADIVGIVLDDDTIHWSTISSVDSSTQITIADATTGAAASGNRVYTYTTLLVKPMAIHHVLRRNSSNVDTEMGRLSYDDYQMQPTKSSSGTPTQYLVVPKTDTTKLFVWPAPENSNLTLEILFTKQLEDMDANADDLDLPQEWEEAVIYNLAVRLAAFYNKEEKLNGLAVMAQMAKEKALSWDNEQASIYLMPSNGGDRR